MFVISQKTLEKTPKVRHVIYFPGPKPQPGKEPKNKNNIEFHPLVKFEELGRNAEIGIFLLSIEKVE
jgi:hypothetical protein